jgi:hypothetical protein
MFSKPLPKLARSHTELTLGSAPQSAFGPEPDLAGNPKICRSVVCRSERAISQRIPSTASAGVVPAPATNFL